MSRRQSSRLKHIQSSRLIVSARSRSAFITVELLVFSLLLSFAAGAALCSLTLLTKMIDAESSLWSSRIAIDNASVAARAASEDAVISFGDVGASVRIGSPAAAFRASDIPVVEMEIHSSNGSITWQRRAVRHAQSDM